MIKTLRITSIIVAVLAAVFVVFPAVFGVRGDEQIEEFLSSAGTIDSIKEDRGGESKDRRNQDSPLVKQAEKFALYLNPPAAPAETAVTDGPTMPHRPAGQVSPKFELCGTSVYPLRPELSLALIDEPGKGQHWVRQGGKVGHLIIQQVKDGLVVVRDGQRTFELAAERPEKRSLVKGASSPIRAKPALSASYMPDVPGIHRVPAGRRIPPRRPQDSAKAAEEEEAEREKMLAELEVMLADIEAGRSGSEGDKERAAEEIEGFISDIKAMRVNAEEAENLDRLGRRLKDVEQSEGQLPVEPNQVEDYEIDSDANLSELDFSESDFNEPDFNEPDLNEPNLD